MEFYLDGVCVGFEIVCVDNGKCVCDGYCDYMLVMLEDGWVMLIFEDVWVKYGV